MTIAGLWVEIRLVSSTVLFLIPFILIWMILRFFGLGGVCTCLGGEDESEESGEAAVVVEVSEVSGVVGSVVCEVSVRVGLSAVVEFVRCRSSGEEGLVSGEVRGEVDGVEGEDSGLVGGAKEWLGHR